MSVTKNKTDARYTENLFRPIFEIQTASVWAAGAVATPFVGLYNFQPGWATTFTISGTMACASVYFFSSAIPMLKQQMKLKMNKKEFMDVTKLRDINLVQKRATKTNWSDPSRTFLGYGFEWGAEHANRAYQVLNMDSMLSDINIPFPFNFVTRNSQKDTEELGGKPFIHALGNEERKTAVEDTFFGHTLIAGSIGTGKTTLLKLLSLNALHMGIGGKPKVLIIIDPKNDVSWKESIQQEMEYLGMGDRFYSVHPAKQSNSARIPLLKNYVRVTEIADRIAPLMGTSGGSKTFEDFAYEQLAFIAQGMEYTGEPIRLTTIRKALNTGKIQFCENVFRVFFERTLGRDYEAKIDLAGATAKGNIEPAAYLSHYYKTKLRADHENQAIEGIVQFLEHPPEHFIKMITSLRPVLTALTTKPMDDLFSPIHDPESTDKRSIVDLDGLMERGGCLYISLDSMTDNQTAGFLARLLTAEVAAVSGRRYNNEDTNAPRVAMFMDEAHAALENNDSLLNLLAVGRASQIELYLATQTISDIEAKTDEATAKRVLGLCNNFISFRTTDPATQEYVTAQFSKTSVTQIQVQSQSGASSKESLFSFTSSHGERAQKTFEDSFPPQLMGDLPKLQYIARMADGRKLKMRLPIIINKNPKGKASWVS
jgi:conjugal transfer pilus assembly protein TraD